MVYTATTKINKKQFDRINRLLDEIDFDDKSQEMNNLIRELDATEDSWCDGFYFTFQNGAKIKIDIRSGAHNYYDDVIWLSADEKDDVLFDCSYTLDEENEYCIDDDTYFCNFIIEED